MTTARRQQGLSLVELMIALLLGTIMTLGVTQIFLGSSQTYRTTDAISLLQENLRFSLSRIGRDVRMAGYYGCMVGQPFDHLDHNNETFNDKDPYNSKLFEIERAAVGWEAPGTGLGQKYNIAGLGAGGGGWTNGTSDTLPKAIFDNAIPGTDILVLSGVRRAEVELEGNPSSPPVTTINTKGASDIKKGRVVLAVMGDCNGGDRFQNTSAASANAITRDGGNSPGNVNNTDLGKHTDDSQVYTYRSTGYFIRPGADGEPALFQVSLEPGGDHNNKAVELISGAENMQVLYGISGVEKRAESYVPASGVTSWENVVSVRIALLMRSDDRIVDEDNGQTFNLIGTEIAPGADRRARLVGNLTVGIRNRLE